MSSQSTKESPSVKENRQLSGNREPYQALVGVRRRLNESLMGASWELFGSQKRFDLDLGWECSENWMGGVGFSSRWRLNGWDGSQCRAQW